MDSLFHYISSITESKINIFLSFSVLLIVYLRYKLTFWKRQGIPNNVLHTYKSFFKILSLNDWNCVKTYGKIVGTYEFLSPTLLIAEPKLINQILAEQFPKFSSHRVWASPKQAMGKSLFVLGYELWKPSRKLIVPVFSSANIKKIRKLFEDSVQLFMKNLQKNSQNRQSFNIKPYFESFVLDTILRAFFATEVDSASDSTNPLVMNSRKVFNNDISFEQLIALFAPTISKYLDFRALNRSSTDFMTNLIQKIINERKNNNIERKDLLQILLDSTDEDREHSTKIRLDDKEVVDNCIMFLIAGFDTTTSGITNLTYQLLKNPSVQENLFKELDEELNGIEPDFENINKLVYLEACIKESLRLEPSVVRIERKTVCNCKLGDVFVPKDTYISIPIKAVHRDPENFENPDEFIPERFLPENKHLIKAGTYLAFADGPRNCIGMRFALLEIKYCLAKLLNKYKLIECDDKEPLEFYSGQIIAMPKHLNLKLEKRFED